MRSNEIINEWPGQGLWGYAKGIVDPHQTGAGGFAKGKAQQHLDQQAKETLPSWKQQQVKDENSGANLNVEQKKGRITQWATRYFKSLGIKPKDYTGPIDGTGWATDQGAIAYFKQIWASVDSLDSDPAEPPAEPPAAPKIDPAAPAPTDPAAPPAAPAAPTADPAHAMFKDPTAFKAEWDKFMASNTNYKLIADPALLSALKTMWMRTGGTKLESKKNSGTRI